MTNTFPILYQYGDERIQPCPLRCVPFELVKLHERQCLTNHGQSVERLKERGGLSLTEMWYVLHNKKLVPYSSPRIDINVAVIDILSIMKKWDEAREVTVECPECGIEQTKLMRDTPFGRFHECTNCLENITEDDLIRR